MPWYHFILVGFILLVKRGCNQFLVNVPTESCLKSSDVLTVWKEPTKCGLLFCFFERSYLLWLGICHLFLVHIHKIVCFCTLSNYLLCVFHPFSRRHVVWAVCELLSFIIYLWWDGYFGHLDETFRFKCSLSCPVC